MKLKCKHSLGYFLTPGKLYEVTPVACSLPDSYYFDYIVTNDKRIIHLIEKDIFISLDEQRNQLIDKIFEN